MLENLKSILSKLCLKISESDENTHKSSQKRVKNKKYFKKGSLINRDLPWCEMGGGGASLSKNRTL